MQNILETACIPNGIAIVLLMVLMLSTQKATHYSAIGDEILKKMVICNLMQCVVEIIAYNLDGKPGDLFTILLLVVNSFLFMNNILFAYLWTVYADYKIFEDKSRIRNRKLLILLPGIAVITGSVINLFYPLFYKISERNVYERSGLYVIPYIVTYFYLAYGMYLIWKYRGKAKKYMFMPVILFMIPILIGSVLQFCQYGMSFIWIGTAIALVSLYVNVQNEASFTDALSGLYTRAYMYQHIKSVTENQNTDTQLAGIMLDIDCFKKINDSFGHLTGDEVITRAGMILRESIGNKGIAVRYAGDEFIVLQQITEIKELNDTVQKIERAAEQFNQGNKRKYQLSFSKGYDVFKSDTDTLDTFLGRIDAFMYQEKKSKKAI